MANPMPALRALLDDHEKRYGRGDVWRAASEEIKRVATFSVIEKNRLCIVPPNQETTGWTVHAEFDGEFGYDKEIGTGETLADALGMAASVIEDTEDVR